MKTDIKVGDIMTRNFVYVKPETSLIDCAREMKRKRVGSLILMDGSELKGILTEGDIIWALSKKNVKLDSVKASDIASRKVATITPDVDVIEAINRMKTTKFKWLPVIANKKVVGMLTIKDVLRIEPSLIESAVEIMSIREETEKRSRVKSDDFEGLCEECGNFDSLSKIDEKLLCDACKDIISE